eukprot:gene37676-61024_t
MRKEYDFTAARKNPYAAQLTKQITIRLDEESISYFKSISQEPDQSVFAGLRDLAPQAQFELVLTTKFGTEWRGVSNSLSTCLQTGPNQLSLTLTEGKYHQVKRMITAVGNRVEGEGAEKGSGG